MAKIVRTVCDGACGDQTRETKPYRIVSEGRAKDVDLCEEDAAPLEKFLEGARARGARATGGRGTGTRRGPRSRVATSVAEVEASKDKNKDKELANA